jgi:hypothetical protein
MEQLGALQGLLGNQPQYAQDNTSFASGAMLGNMNTAGAEGDIERRQRSFENYMQAMGKESQNRAATTAGVASAGASAMPWLMMMSDVRCKRHIYRTGVEVLPGVPEVGFYYREGYGPPGIQIGVVAQDLVAVHPTNGMKMVNYAGLMEAASNGK